MARSGRHLRFGGEKAADLIRRCGEGGITYGCIFLYISVSSGQIFFNKWVLSSSEINFPYPVALTFLHMLFSSVLCFLLAQVFKIITIEGGDDFRHGNSPPSCRPPGDQQLVSEQSSFQKD
ncbi:probable sugar phosphate/phosphate translocator At1g53660 [Zingiber officinale]|uniref:probable sugar phosphate/phosphate translocator At1g53660 n=1 Tax=Zingiber officinale TaxID=94328 RepID=UPI001C4D39FF|nr:probable sugar phosphate/phosphate translocator At1g53660 [Zingiber officinale]